MHIQLIDKKKKKIKKMIYSLFSILTILILVFTTEGQAKTLTPPVKTNAGLVVGEYRKTVLKKIEFASYRSIPYAEKPTKRLRFRPPVPKKPWNHTLHAVTDPHPCIQTDRSTKNIEGVEDCLYLNVYAPHDSSGKGKLKAVIVWIPGGAFTTGNANSSFYGPDFLLEHNVVVVSVQYRLGPFGFLNVDHPGATGNAGLKDQHLAIKWVHKNIIHFGGDPKRVTLLGQSAGGVSVDLHKISDMSTGLFHQTISMSASPLCLYWAFETSVEAQKQAFSLGKRFGVSAGNKDDLLKKLRKASAMDIIKYANELPLIPFRPTIENPKIAKKESKFLTECTLNRYESGRYNKGPHLMGFTLDEILFLANSLDDLVGWAVMAPKIIKAHTPLKDLQLTSKILSVPAYGFSNLTKIEFEKLVTELSDLFFATGIDKKQRLLSKNNDHPVYYYHYTFDSIFSAHRADNITFLNGVAHEDELVHLFYRPHLGLPLKEKRISHLREKLVRMWTNFAKYGNPTPLGSKDHILNVTWPDSRKDGHCLEISDKLKVKLRPINTEVQVFEKAGLGSSRIFNDCEKEAFHEKILEAIGITRAISPLKN